MLSLRSFTSVLVVSLSLTIPATYADILTRQKCFCHSLYNKTFTSPPEAGSFFTYTYHLEQNNLSFSVNESCRLGGNENDCNQPMKTDHDNICQDWKGSDWDWHFCYHQKTHLTHHDRLSLQGFKMSTKGHDEPSQVEWQKREDVEEICGPICEQEIGLPAVSYRSPHGDDSSIETLVMPNITCARECSIPHRFKYFNHKPDHQDDKTDRVTEEMRKVAEKERKVKEDAEFGDHNRKDPDICPPYNPNC